MNAMIQASKSGKNSIQNSTKPGLSRPEIIIIVLTFLLWAGFLYKILVLDKRSTKAIDPAVFHFKDKQYVMRETDTHSKNLILKPSPGIQETALKNTAQRTPARSRNRPAREDPQYLDAIRESLEKVKPAENLIIRSEVNDSDKALPEPQILISFETQMADEIEKLLNDQQAIKQLNGVYRNALKGNNN